MEATDHHGAHPAGRGSFNLAFANLHAVLDAPVEEALKKEALLELAFTQHVAKQYPEAIKSYGIFLRRYPEDPGLPEVLLRQGLLYRDIGSPTTAIAKFHAVMSTALNLNLDEFNYYRRIVLLAQTQIADTLYQDGKLDQAAEKFEVLLREETDLLERTPVQYRLILSLRGLERHAEVIAGRARRSRVIRTLPKRRTCATCSPFH
ncbi:MAG: tetratricopeptide repeat protein [Rhodospirillales bacterium]|nr:tetratricopeptide repeat protein [Rhodospirillales bacterium]